MGSQAQENQPHQTHMRSGSNVFSPPSTRASMDLIEGTTQHFTPAKSEEITAHLQRERWDALFEPQYSFGAFIHGSSQPIDNHYEHQRNLDRLIDDGNSNIKSPMPKPSIDIRHASPTLPSFSTPISDIPREPNDEARLLERLNLLKKIRGTEQNGTEEDTSKIVRWKLQISEKAKQLKKEVRGDTTSPNSTPSMDLEKTEMEENQPAYSRSFLCFVLGFLFPPLWLFGSFYISSYANKQTSASRRIDRIWRRRSRIALGIFTIVLMIILVVVFVVKPGSVGWRLSRQSGSS